MSAASFFESLIWTRFSNPRCFRTLYQRVARHKPVRIVELGISDPIRSLQMIRLAERHADEKIKYCGIDLFEMRSTGILPLKYVHHQLAESAAQVRLVPGDLFSSLGRAANLLVDTDLLVIGRMHSQDEIDAVSHFFPRMLHARTSIARFDGAQGSPRLRWLEPSRFGRTSSRAA
jgi:hypothetical protein